MTIIIVVTIAAFLAYYVNDIGMAQVQIQPQVGTGDTESIGSGSSATTDHEDQDNTQHNTQTCIPSGSCTQNNASGRSGFIQSGHVNNFG
ncbi:MAG TPA: hypothetical protein VH796_11800 [Nitrososphaeraceae archaeon]